MTRRVTGLGGVFFKTRDPEAMKSWYNKHLHLDAGEHGAMFKWRDLDKPEIKGSTVWSPFPEDSDYFQPAKKEFMFNYRVENLVELLKVLKEEGIEVVGEIEEYSYGKFGWIMDPDGNNDFIEQPQSAKHNVLMAYGEWVE